MEDGGGGRRDDGAGGKEEGVTWLVWSGWEGENIISSIFLV